MPFGGRFIRVTGDKAIEKALKELPPASFRKVVRQGVNACLTPGLKRARMLAPVGPEEDAITGAKRSPGALRRSLGKKLRTYSKTGVIYGVIGPLKGYSEHGQAGKQVPEFYTHLVELGVASHNLGQGSERFHRSGGKIKGVSRRMSGANHPGFAGQPFLENAAQQVFPLCKVIFNKKVVTAIEKEAVRLARKAEAKAATP